MSWLGWATAIFCGLVAVDILFVGALMTADAFREWRERHEHGGSSSKNH